VDSRGDRLCSPWAIAPPEIYAYEIATRRYTKLTEDVFAALGNLSRDGSIATLTIESPSFPRRSSYPAPTSRNRKATR
jgi:hypothetical protein